jgi:hypothetical protein
LDKQFHIIRALRRHAAAAHITNRHLQRVSGKRAYIAIRVRYEIGGEQIHKFLTSVAARLDSFLFKTAGDDVAVRVVPPAAGEYNVGRGARADSFNFNSAKPFGFGIYRRKPRNPVGLRFVVIAAKARPAGFVAKVAELVHASEKFIAASLVEYALRFNAGTHPRCLDDYGCVHVVCGKAADKA